MPESPSRRRLPGFLRRNREEDVADFAVSSSGMPAWYAPAMVTLMVVGLLWIVTTYVTRLEYPVPGWSYWNLAAGFGLALVGFVMMTRWK